MNDNIGLLTRNPDWETKLILNRLRNAQTLRELARNEEKPEQRKDDPKPGDGGKRKPEDDLEYVQHRLREIASWEKKINGGRKV